MILLAVVALAGLRVKAPEGIPGRPTKFAARVSALLMIAPLVLTATWSGPDYREGEGLPVRVMSYNIHQAFGTEGGFTLEEIAQVIESEDADIVGLQEVSRGWMVDGSVDILSWLSQRLDMDYAWGPAADSVWGNAVLSRYPIVNYENFEMPNNDAMLLDRAYMRVEVDVGDLTPLNVIATHFHHIGEDGELRVQQSEAVLEGWGGAVRTVLIGDLNAVPSDPEMVMLTDAGLLDSFVDAGRPGSGATSPAEEPRRRIDYVWTSPDLRSTDYSTADSQASDHLPVTVTVNRR